MCRVYNQIGCLTVIENYLREHRISDLKTIPDLLDFKKGYSNKRHQIISNHEYSIKQERTKLDNEIVQLNQAIFSKKIQIRKKLVLNLNDWRKQLKSLQANNTTLKQAIITNLQRVVLKGKILILKIIGNLRTIISTYQLTALKRKKSKRFQFVSFRFDEAVLENAKLELQYIDYRKAAIDEINSFIYGALGEQSVVRELEKLPDNWILINDFNCRFNPAIYNKEGGDYINSVQVDHILVAPSGVFVIETKNWNEQSLNNQNLFSPVTQIKRAGIALYKVLNGKISLNKIILSQHRWGSRKLPVKNLIVFTNSAPLEKFQFVRILSLTQLLSHVKYFDPIFSSDEVQRIADFLLKQLGRSIRK